MHRTIGTFVAGLVLLAMVGAPVGAVVDTPISASIDRSTVENEAYSTTDAPECSFPFTVTDATGTDVHIDEEPETVVTLNPSAAQTMWEIGAREKVVGVTKHASNLEGADDRKNVSAAGETISTELVTELDPDLVLVPSSTVATEEIVETLREAGLTVYYYPTSDSIDEVRDRTVLTGRMVGECEGAHRTVEWMDEELDVVERAVADEPHPGVLYVFFGFTAGNGTHVHDVLEAAGAINLAAEAGIVGYEQLNEETVVEADPDWIVLNSNSPELPDRAGFERTSAVESNRTVVIDINVINRPGPRIVHAVTRLAETFHPEAYAEAKRAGESTPTSDQSIEGTPPTDSNSPGNSTPTQNLTSTPLGGPDEQPGFGPISALVSLVIVALALGGRSRGT